MATSEFIHNVGDTPIHAVHAGKPGRQIALLIHGWSSSWYALNPLLGILSQRFTCIAIDLPGYGQSPPLPERATIPGYAELLADLIEGLSDGPVVLVGHSMGGMISLTLAAKYPALVERMVLLNPTISGKLSTTINWSISPITLMERFGLGSLIVSAVEKLFVGITDRLMRPISFAERTGITEQDYSRLRADARRPGQGRVRAECFFAMRDNDLSGKLSEIETPSLVIWGAEDNTVPLRDAGVVADEWPLADLRIFPKAGHWPQFETPETTRRQVAAFLGLPLLSNKLYTPVDDEELARINEIANFLAHSEIGNQLNLAQRTRLAAQFTQKKYHPHASIVSEQETGHEMYVVQSGTVEVWQVVENDETKLKKPQRVATLQPGQMAGELSMIDQNLRTADLIVSAEGATVLALDRERLLALAQDDAVLGTQLLWNIASTMSQRVRFILWQRQREVERASSSSTGKPSKRVKTIPVKAQAKQ